MCAVSKKIAETFPARLRRMRKRRGLEQKDLAKRCYVHVNMIFRYESGMSTPSTDVLCKLADVFDVSVDYLLCRTDDPRTF
jgi:transcriptional regulator with XRE-family HTH domain